MSADAQRPAGDRQAGYITLVVVFILTLLAVVAFSINRRAGLQLRMVQNLSGSMQRELNARSALEFAEWRLLTDSRWRTSVTGQTVRVAGEQMRITTADVTLPVVGAAVMVTVDSASRTSVLRAAYAPTDEKQRIYIADPDKHRVRVVQTNGMIYAFAGTGSSGYEGDGGAAISAKLKRPEAVVVDADGNVYIADRGDDRIRMVSRDGLIRTVVGTGSGGYTGDGGAATNARIRAPTGMSFDAAGNLLFADRDNHRIRRVSTAGIITTVAGNGAAGYAGDDGPATSAALKSPSDVSVAASGNIYIADTDNCMVRRVLASDGSIQRFAGGLLHGSPDCDCGSTRLQGPQGIFVTTYYIYLADTDNDRILRYTGSGSMGSVVNAYACSFGGGDGPDGGWAWLAQANRPERLVVAADGALYYADRENHRVRRVDPDTGLLSTVAGTGSAGDDGDGGPATAARLGKPQGVAVETVLGGYQPVLSAY